MFENNNEYGSSPGDTPIGKREVGISGISILMIGDSWGTLH